MSTSRIPAFHRMPVEERRRKLAGALDLSPADLETLGALHALPLEVADTMVENALGTFALPFGVALNFLVNGREHVIPMVVEEPSVIAAASSARQSLPVATASASIPFMMPLLCVAARYGSAAANS